MTYREKRGKRENEEEKKENRETEGGKLGKIANGMRKSNKMRRGPFFLAFHFSKPLTFVFGSTKMGIFYREKAFHTRKKIRKNDSAPSEKYSPLTPAWGRGLQGQNGGVKKF